jgi:hypothetical protein
MTDVGVTRSSGRVRRCSLTNTSLTVAVCATLLWAGPALAKPSPGQICAAAKERAAGLKAARKLTCYSRYTKSGGSFDLASCLQKAETKFTTAFRKAEFTAKGAPRGCVTSGDADAIEALVDDFVAAVVAALPAVPVPTSTPTSPPATPTTTPTVTPVTPTAETVLFVGGSPGGCLGAELHPGGSWITTPLADATNLGTSLTFTSAGQGVAVISSTTGPGEVHAAIWSSTGWQPFSAPAAGAIAHSQPFVDANGGPVAHVIFQSQSFVYYYLAYSGVWTSLPESAGSYGPVAASIASLGADATIGFIDGQAPHVNYAATSDRTGGSWQVPEDIASANSTIPASIIALSAGPELMMVYVQNGGSQIMFTTRTAGAWSTPAPVTNGVTNDRVALAPLPGGGAIMAFHGSDDFLYWNLYSGGAWSPAAAFAAPNVSVSTTPAVTHGISGDTAEIAFVEAGGAAYHASLAGGVWSAPVLIGGTGLNGVALASWP